MNRKPTPRTTDEVLRRIENLRPQIAEADREGMDAEEIASFSMVTLPDGLFVKVRMAPLGNLRFLRLDPVTAQVLAFELQAACAVRGWLVKLPI